METRQLGEECIAEYWSNFGITIMMEKGKTVKITNIKDFLEFKGKIGLRDKIVLKKISNENSCSTNKKPGDKNKTRSLDP